MVLVLNACWLLGLQGVQSVLTRVGSGDLAQDRPPCPLPRPVRCPKGPKWRGTPLSCRGGPPCNRPTQCLASRSILCTAGRWASSFLNTRLIAENYNSSRELSGRATKSLIDEIIELVHTTELSRLRLPEHLWPRRAALNLQLGRQAPATQDLKYHLVTTSSSFVFPFQHILGSPSSNP